MADEAAAAEGGQSFLWWLLSPLLGLGIFLIPMAVIGTMSLMLTVLRIYLWLQPLIRVVCCLIPVSVIGFFMYKLVNSLNEKERRREEKKKLKEQKKKK